MRGVILDIVTLEGEGVILDIVTLEGEGGNTGHCNNGRLSGYVIGDTSVGLGRGVTSCIDWTDRGGEAHSLDGCRAMICITLTL